MAADNFDDGQEMQSQDEEDEEEKYNHDANDYQPQSIENPEEEETHF